MSDNRNYNLPFPDTQQHWLQACSMHVAKVVKVDAPTGDGRVQVVCSGLWGTEVSNWLSNNANSVGNNDTGRGHTGLWNPAQPGQKGYVMFPGGNYKKPVFMAAGPWMSEKGEA